MSIHRVDVVNIDSYENHPDPETTRLGIVSVFGFQVIINKETFVPGLFFYVQPDSLVNVERPEFEFLKPQAGNKQMYRVRVKKLRGFYSQGLLIPATDEFNEGDDAAEFLGVLHYEPPLSLRGGDNVKPPKKRIIQESIVVGEQEVYAPHYDIENLNRFNKVFDEINEEVVATEKIHGCAHFSTVLETEDGNKTIQEICESEYNGKVKSYDIEKNEYIFTKIINHSIQEDNDDWYEIETEDGTILKLTSNHQVWLNDLMCYRSVLNLKIGDMLLIQ